MTRELLSAPAPRPGCSVRPVPLYPVNRLGEGAGVVVADDEEAVAHGCLRRRQVEDVP